MSTWLIGLPAIGYGMAVTYLLRRHGSRVFALVVVTDGMVAVLALVALMIELSSVSVIAASTGGWTAPLDAAIAVTAAAVGAAIAVALMGTTATTAMHRRPVLVGRRLVVVGLSEGIAIYGLVVGSVLLGTG